MFALHCLHFIFGQSDPNVGFTMPDSATVQVHHSKNQQCTTSYYPRTLKLFNYHKYSSPCLTTTFTVKGANTVVLCHLL